MKPTHPGNTAKPTILIVDDEPDLVSTIRDFFDLMEFETAEAANGVEAMIQLQRASFDIVMTDLKMPEMDGMVLLDRLREHWPGTAVIVMTGYGTIENAVEAMKRGASDYILKPIAFDQISLVVDKILERRKLLDENAYLREKVEEKYGFDNIIGQSRRMLEIYEIIAAVAGTDSTVLIQGRERNRKGTGGERHPLQQPTLDREDDHRQLLRADRQSIGKRVVRTCAGGLHRRDQGQTRTLRAGGFGHAVSG